MTDEDYWEKLNTLDVLNQETMKDLKYINEGWKSQKILCPANADASQVDTSF